MKSSTAVATDRLQAFEEFDQCLVSFVDQDGYPNAVPAKIEVDSEHERLVLEGPALSAIADGTSVGVSVSHIRPVEGMGYDQRRYAVARGPFEARDGGGTLAPEKVSGWDEKTTPFFEYCERSVPRGLRYLDSLGADQGRELKPRLSLGWRFFSATRVPFLSATILPVLLGALIARDAGATAWWLVAAAMVGAIAIHLGLNVANDVFDTRSGADEANSTPTPFSGGSRVLQYNLVSMRAMSWLAVGLFGTGIAIGLVLAAMRGWQLLVIGGVGVFLAIAYTAPPLKLAYRGLGDIAVAMGFGPITTVGTYFVVAQSVTLKAVYASLPLAIFVMLILYVNQVPDREADAVAGKRTLAVRLSSKSIISGYDIAVVAGFALIVLGVMASWMPPGCLLALLATPLAVVVHRGLSNHYDSPYELMGAMGLNIALHAAVGVALIAGYTLAVAI